MEKKFTFVDISHFDTCYGCPFWSFHDDDNDYRHDRYDKLDRYIKIYSNIGDEDFRNNDGVLDGCPFLTNNVIAEEDN
jgi:hypothetical protein